MKSISRMWERVRNVPGLGRDLLAVAVFVTVGVVSGAYILSQYGWQPPWQDRFTFAADFEKAFGVRPASRQEVRIAGVTVGKIEEAKPASNHAARLTMSVRPGIEIYSNARAVLRTKSPLNVMYVALDPGGRPAKPLPENGVIPMSQTERPIQPFEVLNKLDERARVALTSLVNQADAALADAPEHLPAGLQATHTTMERFRPVIKQLHTRRETVSQLVTSLSQIAKAAGHDKERLASLAASLQETLSVLAKRDKQLSETLAQVPGFSKDLRHAMSGTRKLTGQLNPILDAVHRASGHLEPTLSRLSKTVSSADSLIDAARPAVRKARPVVADLRPLVGDVHSAVNDLAPVTADLPSATRRIVPWMNDLAAFVYQTSSAFSLSDTNGGLGRANLTVDIGNPTGGLGPQGSDGAKGGPK